MSTDFDPNSRPLDTHATLKSTNVFALYNNMKLNVIKHTFQESHFTVRFRIIIEVFGNFLVKC